MSSKDREVKEGVQYQGTSEEITYSFASTPWASSPSSVVVTVLDASNAYEDVTTTVAPDETPSPSGDVITLQLIKNLTEGHKYLVLVQFAGGGNTLAPYFYIIAQR